MPKEGKNALVKAQDAINAARALIGTPYAELDCIGLITRVIRTAPGGQKAYTTAGTNTLWNSFTASAKYRDLTWRQEGVQGAMPGMLAFKRSGSDVHHVGLVTERGTVIHSSSAQGRVVETALDGSWQLLGVHRYIQVAEAAERTLGDAQWAVVTTRRDPLRIRESPVNGRIIGHAPRGALVRVLGDGGDGWPCIEYDGLAGVVSGAYLSRAED